MKIDYDFDEEYFKYYNETNGAIYLLPKLLKNNKLKVRTYIYYMSLNCFYIFLLGLVIMFIAYKIDSLFLFEIACFVIGIITFFAIFFIVWLYVCSKLEINSRKGTISIKKEGIVDENQVGNKMIFNYNNLKSVIVTKNLIVCAFNYPLMLFMPNTNKDKIIKEIEKYSDVQIIDNN